MATLSCSNAGPDQVDAAQDALGNMSPASSLTCGSAKTKDVGGISMKDSKTSPTTVGPHAAMNKQSPVLSDSEMTSDCSSGPQSRMPPFARSTDTNSPASSSQPSLTSDVSWKLSAHSIGSKPTAYSADPATLGAPPPPPPPTRRSISERLKALLNVKRSVFRGPPSGMTDSSQWRNGGDRGENDRDTRAQKSCHTEVLTGQRVETEWGSLDDNFSGRPSKNSRATRRVSPTLLFLGAALLVLFFGVWFPGPMKAVTEAAAGKNNLKEARMDDRNFDTMKKVTSTELGSFLHKEGDHEWDRINELFQVSVLTSQFSMAFALAFCEIVSVILNLWCLGEEVWRKHIGHSLPHHG